MAGLLRQTVKKLRSLGGFSGPIKGIHSTFDQWFDALPAIQHTAHSKQIVAPAAIFPKVPPQYVQSDLQFDAASHDDQGDTYLEREKFVARISGAMVGTFNCEILTPDHWLI